MNRPRPERPRDRSPLTALVADDEALARRRIADLLRARTRLRIVGESVTGPETVAAVRRLDPDILFLDVQMPGLDGFEVLGALDPQERPVVVFSTAYDEHAIRAFEVHAVDYLVKPFADDRFVQAVERAAHAIRTRGVLELHDRLRGLLEEVADEGPSGQDARPSNGHLTRFSVPSRERYLVIEADAVDWIEAAGDYVNLHVGARTYLLRATMFALERRLDSARFFRIHRSSIVQIDRVKGLHPDSHGDYVVVLADGRTLRVGRAFRDAVLTRLGMRW